MNKHHTNHTALGRRAFLGRTLAAGAAWGFPSIGVAGTNDEIRIAIVGLNSKGRHHIELFGRVPGVRIVALCDVDKNVLARNAKEFFGGKIGQHIDYREVLDRKDVDAVCLATPNHWHALGAVWACEAGKDVYLEKPVSHNLWEGRQIIAAAARSGRIVASGTQSRSAPGNREFVADVRAGIYGPVKVARGLCYKERKSIGKVGGPQTPPPEVDYNLWSGPREMLPIRRGRFHYDWHWQWAYGNGDLGNQGIHQMDLCRWILGVDALAPRVVSLGGRFGYDDDGVTPNTQTILFDYPQAPLVFEVRGLPDAADSPRMSHYRGGRVAAVIEFEGGYFVGTDGGVFFDQHGKTGESLPRRTHHRASRELHQRHEKPALRRPQRQPARRPSFQRALPHGQHFPPSRHSRFQGTTRRSVQHRRTSLRGLRKIVRARARSRTRLHGKEDDAWPEPCLRSRKRTL